MRGIINDIIERTGYTIEYINSFPPDTLREWWREWLIPNLAERAKYVADNDINKTKDSDLEKFEQLKREAGAI